MAAGSQPEAPPPFVTGERFQEQVMAQVNMTEMRKNATNRRPGQPITASGFHDYSLAEIQNGT